MEYALKNKEEEIYMSDIAENKKGFKNKKITLIVIIIILIILFIGYGISFKSTPESREK